VYRWYQAKRDGFAPRVVLGATNHAALRHLEQFNINLDGLSEPCTQQTSNQRSNKTTNEDL